MEVRNLIVKDNLNKFKSIIVTTLIFLVSCDRGKIEVTFRDGVGSNITSTGTLSKTDEVIAALQNYILVPGNATLGTDDFYIMMYEAKAWADDNTDSIVDDSELDFTSWTHVGLDAVVVDLLTLSHTPVSHLTQKPWDQTPEGAWDACDNLNSEGTRGNIDSDINADGTFALTSNPEWMTVARNIEAQAVNWTSGVVGTDCLKRGNIGGAIPCNGIDSGFNGYGATVSSTNPLAKLVLSNGEEIWDLAGSVAEWVDWDTTGEFTGVAAGDKACGTANGSQYIGYIQFTTIVENVAV
jgi:hypothetical protein